MLINPDNAGSSVEDHMLKHLLNGLTAILLLTAAFASVSDEPQHAAIVIEQR